MKPDLELRDAAFERDAHAYAGITPAGGDGDSLILIKFCDGRVMWQPPRERMTFTTPCCIAVLLDDQRWGWIIDLHERQLRLIGDVRRLPSQIADAPALIRLTVTQVALLIAGEDGHVH